MTDSQLKEFLEKYEQFLGQAHPLITPENWHHYKEHGTLPDPSLKERLLKSGFNKDLIIQTYSDGNLSKADLFELFDNVFTKDEVEALTDHWCDVCLFGPPSDNDELLLDALLDYTAE